MNGPFTANETYTLTIQGGENGIKNKSGNRLSAEATIRLKTDDRPVFQMVKLNSCVDKFDQEQINVYQFYAEKGVSGYKIWQIADGNQIRL